MKTSTKLAIAFVAISGSIAGAALAQGGNDRMNRRDGGMPRLEKADADNSGDVSFDEFSAAMKSRFNKADANADGKVTVEEVAAEIERMRAERMAKRMIERFDTDGDGALTAAEIESRQKKMFALLDRNDDGKIAKEEMPKRKFGRKHDRDGDRRGHRHD